MKSSQNTKKKKTVYIYIFLLWILPIMDSLNGFINGGGNENGLSLGIVYRFVIVIVSIFYLLIYGINKKYLIYFLSFCTFLVISMAINNGEDSFSYLILLFKLVLPIIIIITIDSLAKKKLFRKEHLTFLMNSWTIIFPLTLLLAYVLGIGFSTYGDGTSMGGRNVGFKGLYFAQNDISYIIDILYLYVMNKIFKHVSPRTIFEYLMVLSSSILMGLKGNYLIIILITIACLFKSESSLSRNFRKTLLFMLIVLSILAFLSFFANEINQIIERWQYFYNKNSLISFLTSARSDRLAPTFSWLFANYGIVGLLCGSGYNYTNIVISKFIEMDPFDIILQLGLIGFIFVYGFYVKLYLNNRNVVFYSTAFLLTLLISTLSGHVFETALSGVFLGVICSGLIISGENKI